MAQKQNTTKQQVKVVAKELGVAKGAIKTLVEDEVISYEIINGQYYVDIKEVKQAFRDKKAQEQLRIKNSIRVLNINIIERPSRLSEQSLNETFADYKIKPVNGLSIMKIESSTYLVDIDKKIIVHADNTNALKHKQEIETRATILSELKLLLSQPSAIKKEKGILNHSYSIVGISYMAFKPTPLEFLVVLPIETQIPEICINAEKKLFKQQGKKLFITDTASDNTFTGIYMGICEEADGKTLSYTFVDDDINGTTNRINYSAGIIHEFSFKEVA